MQKQLKAYFKDIKKNLPCYNKVMRKMLNNLKLSVDTYIKDDNISDFEKIIEHFGTAEDIAKEFAIGIDNAYVKSYKFKKRVTATVVSILAAILLIVSIFSIYIYIENQRYAPVFYNDKITYEKEK